MPTIEPSTASSFNSQDPSESQTSYLSMYFPRDGSIVETGTNRSRQILASLRLTFNDSRVTPPPRHSPEFMREFNEVWTKTLWIMPVEPWGWGPPDAPENEQFPLWALYKKDIGDTSNDGYDCGEVSEENPVDVDWLMSELFLRYAPQTFPSEADPGLFLGEAGQYRNRKNAIFREIALLNLEEKRLVLETKREATLMNFFEKMYYHLNQVGVLESGTLAAGLPDVDLSRNLVIMHFTLLYQTALELYVINELKGFIEDNSVSSDAA